MNAGGRPLVCSRRSSHVAKIAPKVIWPSMPMFHSPAVNVTRSPAVERSSGTHETSTFATTSQDPAAPSTMLRYAASGGALAARSTSVVRRTAQTMATI